MKISIRPASLIIMFLGLILISIASCDDAQEHRDKMEYLRQEEERKAFETKRDKDKKVVDVQAEADIAYYEDRIAALPDGAVIEIFKLGSDLAVENGGRNATVNIPNDVYAVELWTYHYNNGSGAPAGTLKMIADDGTVYGPWKASVRNTFYWVAALNRTIPAGTYTVIDSDPGTWSQNSETKGMGMTWMMGVYE